MTCKFWPPLLLTSLKHFSWQAILVMMLVVRLLMRLVLRLVLTAGLTRTHWAANSPTLHCVKCNIWRSVRSSRASHQPSSYSLSHSDRKIRGKSDNYHQNTSRQSDIYLNISCIENIISNIFSEANWQSWSWFGQKGYFKNQTDHIDNNNGMIFKIICFYWNWMIHCIVFPKNYENIFFSTYILKPHNQPPFEIFKTVYKKTCPINKVDN